MARLRNAIRRGEKEKVRQALQALPAGADVNLPDTEGRTALHLAAEEGLAGIARALLARGANPAARSGTRRTPLHEALAAGQGEVAALLAHTAKPDDLWALAGLGRTDALKQALATRQGGSATQAATRRATRSTTAPPTRPASRPAGAAATQPATQAATRPARWDDPADGPGWTALHYAAQWGRTGCVNVLLTHGSSPATQTRLGQTPLHLAACGGHAAVAKLLLLAGADANARDLRGKTPLHLAAEQGHAGVLLILVRHKADLRAAYVEGMTALHLAAAEGRLAATRILLNAGANPNHKDSAGRTPADLAAAAGHKTLAAYLRTKMRR